MKCNPTILGEIRSISLWKDSLTAILNYCPSLEVSRSNIMVTNKQALTSVTICQSLTKTLCSIELFRFDETRRVIYILAVTSRKEELEVIINENGELNRP